MFENFPYTDMHQLNLDWIIKIAKDFLDQYTTIQNTIDEGLEELGQKAEELEALLQEWYNTHSEDIANELADALQAVTDRMYSAITLFNQAADEKAQEAIASIPSDYSELSNAVDYLKIALKTESEGTYPISSLNLAQGNFIDGVLVAATNRVSYNGYIPVYNGMECRFYPGATIDRIFCRKYDKYFNSLGDTGWLDESFTIDWEGYAIIVFKNHLDSTITVANYDADTFLFSYSMKSIYNAIFGLPIAPTKLISQTTAGATFSNLTMNVPSGSTGIGSWFCYYYNFLKYGLLNRLTGKHIRIRIALELSGGFLQHYADIGLKLRRMQGNTQTTITDDSTTNKTLIGNCLWLSQDYTITSNDYFFGGLIQILNNVDTTATSTIRFIDSEIEVLNNDSLTERINKTNIEEIARTKNQYVTVGKDGNSDFSVLKTAMEWVANNADGNENNPFTIIVKPGTYDLYDEFGGADWVQSITIDGGQRQGLTLPNYCRMVGLGSVKITMNIPNEVVTYVASQCVSTLNTMPWNEIENITFEGKNIRYVIHDEMDIYSNIHRKYKNCYFHRLAGNEAIDPTSIYSTSTFGSGTGNGGTYDFIDCIFEGNGSAFSMHNNANQNSNIVSFDGCYMNNAMYGHSIGFGYLGNNTNRNRVFIKDCIYNDIYVHQENETPSVNIWDIYNFVEGTVPEP